MREGFNDETLTIEPTNANAVHALRQQARCSGPTRFKPDHVHRPTDGRFMLHHCDPFQIG